MRDIAAKTTTETVYYLRSAPLYPEWLNEIVRLPWLRHPVVLFLIRDTQADRFLVFLLY